MSASRSLPATRLMTYDRINLRRTKRGPIVAVLFGVVITGRTLTVEAALIPEPIKRSIFASFQTTKFRIPKLSPGLYGPLFGSAVPSFEVING